MAAASGDDLMEAISLATAVRISVRELRSAGRAYAGAIVGALSSLVATAPQMVPLARAAAEPGLECALGEARQTLAAILADPAAPGLEDDYVCALWELGELASAFVGDPDEPPLEEYQRLTSTLAELLRAAETARPIWRILRREPAAARRKPPTRPRCTEPHADPKEYYM